MKKRNIYIVLTLLFLLISKMAIAQPKKTIDDIQISLLTCSPGQEIWAQFGHTALRYHNLTTGEDVAINYGIFSSSQPYFIPRFILGLTDYSMGIMPMSYFLEQYRYENRGVIEQVLNLTTKDKEVIRAALEQNMKPENIVYRYNYFYDNCTTRARDMIIDHLSSKVDMPPAKPNLTYRMMLHKWNKQYEWSQFGEDLLLGVNADKPTNKSEQQFLPDNLREDFSKAIYRGQPLVQQTNILLHPVNGEVKAEFIFSPFIGAILFSILLLPITLISFRKKRFFWLCDCFLMLTAGVLGLIYFIMIFSQHPCVSLNLIILFFNPLPLFFLPSTIRKTKHNSQNRWWSLWTLLIALGLISTFIQRIPLPIIIVASFLLIYCIAHITGTSSSTKINNK